VGSSVLGLVRENRTIDHKKRSFAKKEAWLVRKYCRKLVLTNGEYQAYVKGQTLIHTGRNVVGSTSSPSVLCGHQDKKNRSLAKCVRRESLQRGLVSMGRQDQGTGIFHTDVRSLIVGSFVIGGRRGGAKQD
jgi:hypothetical protein